MISVRTTDILWRACVLTGNASGGAQLEVGPSRRHRLDDASAQLGLSAITRTTGPLHQPSALAITGTNKSEHIANRFIRRAFVLKFCVCSSAKPHARFLFNSHHQLRAAWSSCRCPFRPASSSRLPQRPRPLLQSFCVGFAPITRAVSAQRPELCVDFFNESTRILNNLNPVPCHFRLINATSTSPSGPPDVQSVYHVWATFAPSRGL
jgi:hypothetical protein